MVRAFHFRFTRFSPNYKEIAWRLVEKHPEVRSLVMTAVEQKSDETSGQLNYLQERLLREAISHANQSVDSDRKQSAAPLYGKL